ncbi:class I SAM-dependent methyltransferase [Psychromicrobium xiongbiense]|uniref:class I SAM-dependent methyltransferase n=1 Tax=Psychromicrobium xiongbiense TaxID=3051184 RepID=UPI002555E790|nr:class I SAM-dependent methyltransferase [Psychromicrobium sp. YIM S02556]
MSNPNTASQASPAQATAPRPPQFAHRDPGLAFTDGAAQFNSWSEQLWDPAARIVVERAALTPGQTVLDACCGAGAATLPAAELVGPEGAVDGVDLSSGLLALAGRRLAERGILHTTLTEADVTSWRGHRRYDAVLCCYSAFFFSPMAAGVDHLVSMLAAGGIFVMSTWAEGALSPLAEVILEAAVTERPRLAGVTPEPNRNMALISDVDSLERWLRARGLVNVAVSIEPLSLTVSAELAWALVMGSGWRTLLPRDPEAIARVRAQFLKRIAKLSDPQGLIAFNSDTLIGSGQRG